MTDQEKINKIASEIINNVFWDKSGDLCISNRKFMEICSIVDGVDNRILNDFVQKYSDIFEKFGITYSDTVATGIHYNGEFIYLKNSV